MRSRLFTKRSPLKAALAFLSVLIAAGLIQSTANAVVEQTDGLVVPIQVANCPGSGMPNGCIQVGLNIGEGLPATSTNNPLNAIFSATTSPEIFAIPKKNNVYGIVTVTDLIEGAGYENSFGWYNIDDPANLYVITPCADEPTSTRTVDFQMEFNQGHYKGGFIGFFLITPEQQPNPNNCGSVGNVGYLYYTEQAKNGDGNYVHYLLYSSKVDPLTFYFGFEDLWRGGDNDFEDMFLKVTGLLAPCTPTAEICDGLDNNCDGLIDNNTIDSGGNCGATDTGECSYGTLICQNSALVCIGAVGPSPEVCDNLDNNCDGLTDNNTIDSGTACGTDVGECAYGTNQCIGGSLVCVGGKGPTLELCNSLDDDCDGTTDESTIDAGGPCGSDVGACDPGVLTCIAGTIECIGGKGPTPEVCNSVDDNCSGAIDDGDPGGGNACGTDVGQCDPGVEHCIGGKIVCVGALGPSEELCDGLDNDCNGENDNLAPCPDGSKCISGTCASPCGSGEFDCPGGQVCSMGYCIPVSCDNVMCPAGETCVQGICVKDGAGGAGGASSSGSAGGGNQGGGNQGGASGSSSSGTASGGNQGGSSGDHQKWGLSTGGGGLSCNAAGKGEGGGAGVLPLLAGLSAWIGRRLRQRRRRPAQKQAGGAQ